MKNKLFVRSIITVLLAFMLYSANAKRINSAQIKILEPKTSKVTKKKSSNKKQPQEPTAPKISSAEYDKKVSYDKGSNKKLLSKVEKVMGKNSTYQVAIQDLNNSSRYVRVANSSRVQNVDETMHVFVLIALYRQMQTGKWSSATTIKVKKSDKVKSDSIVLQPNIQYSLAYLRQAMISGSKTAANALVRSIGKSKIQEAISRSGASQTTMKGNFSHSPVGTTTAKDLNQTLISIYQTRVLKKNYAYRVLSAMATKKNKLTSMISGTVYTVGDDNSVAAIVQSGGHSYAISVWSNTDKNFANLGKTVEDWFSQK